jgi:hypothetical protein
MGGDCVPLMMGDFLATYMEDSSRHSLGDADADVCCPKSAWMS